MERKSSLAGLRAFTPATAELWPRAPVRLTSFPCEGKLRFELCSSQMLTVDIGCEAVRALTSQAQSHIRQLAVPCT
jgi:hypothetical protein